jgi:hypothetical protein
MCKNKVKRGCESMMVLIDLILMSPTNWYQAWTFLSIKLLIDLNNEVLYQLHLTSVTSYHM